MIGQTPSNPELSAAAVAFTIFLCIIFGSNAVAVKVTFMGLGVFTTAAIRFGIAALAIYFYRVRDTGGALASPKRSTRLSDPARDLIPLQQQPECFLGVDSTFGRYVFCRLGRTWGDEYSPVI